jgi:hypothetical protein
LATALLICCADTPADAPVTTLALPRAPQADEAVVLELKLGSLTRGNRVEISTPTGRLLGAISAFGSGAGIYTVPIPADAVSDDHISVRILVNDGKKKRPPAANEIQSVTVKLSARSQ